MADNTAQPKLEQRIRDACRVRHYALATERVYVGWYKRFVRWVGLKHPATLGGDMVEALCELRIANNLASMVAAAQAALAALMGRVKAGRGWTLYGTEICAVRDALWLYSVQIGLCSCGEHLRAIELVRNRISAALAGNAGPRARVHAAPEQAAA